MLLKFDEHKWQLMIITKTMEKSDYSATSAAFNWHKRRSQDEVSEVHGPSGRGVNGKAYYSYR